MKVDASQNKKENAVQFPGSEPDEPISGNELNVPISGNELDEPISGNKLDEPNNESKKVTIETEVKNSGKKFQGKRTLFIFAAIGLCFLAGGGYFYRHMQKEKPSGLIKLYVPSDLSILFDSFVIPFKKNNEYTYISLSISFRTPDKKLKMEMTEKKDQLRAVLYEMLKEEINRADEIPPLEKLKDNIIQSVNQRLSSGKVNEAYIMDFLAV